MRWNAEKALALIVKLSVELQDHKCPISGHKIIYDEKSNTYKTITHDGSLKTCVLDHDHNTGYLRGVLCNFTNMLLGPAEKRYYGDLSSVIHNSELVQSYYKNPPLGPYKILYPDEFARIVNKSTSQTGWSDYLKQKFNEFGWQLCDSIPTKSPTNSNTTQTVVTRNALRLLTWLKLNKSSRRLILLPLLSLLCLSPLIVRWQPEPKQVNQHCLDYHGARFGRTYAEEQCK